MNKKTMPAYDDRWPELFAGLTDEQRKHVLQTAANSFLEGAEHSREDIAQLCAVAGGKLSVQDAIRAAVGR